MSPQDVPFPAGRDLDKVNRWVDPASPGQHPAVGGEGDRSDAIRQVQTPDEPVPGFTEAQARDVRGDALDHPVRWQDNADLGRLLGKEIRLKFYMTRARIHAMTLSHEDRKLGAVEGEYRDEKPGGSAPRVN